MCSLTVSMMEKVSLDEDSSDRSREFWLIFCSCFISLKMHFTSLGDRSRGGTRSIRAKVQGELHQNYCERNSLQRHWGGGNIGFQKPSEERIAKFQKVLMDNKVVCYVRAVRGDDESSACGQLATQRKDI